MPKYMEQGNTEYYSKNEEKHGKSLEIRRPREKKTASARVRNTRTAYKLQATQKQGGK